MSLLLPQRPTDELEIPDPLDVAAEMLDPTDHPHLHDHRAWVKERLDETLWSAQAEVCEAIDAHRYVAVPSSHDTGKSFVAARIAAHWIDTHPLGEALVITTAPTWSQVKSILWHEIATAHRKGQLPGRLTEDAKWKVSLGLGPDIEAGLGRKPRDYDPSAFQGFHRRYVLVIIDEAGGMPKAMWDAVDTVVTNEDAKVLAIGNPDDAASHFARVCEPGSGWKVVHIDGLRSPNFTAEEVAKYPALRSYMIQEGIVPTTEPVPHRLRPLWLSPRWVDERIRRWGPSSPMFQSKVRGRFPNVTVNTLIHPRWVALAQARELAPDHTNPRMGVDVARYGTDHTIIVMRLGGHCRVVEDIASGPTTEVAGLVIQHGLGRPQVPVANVDDTGVGGGVTDILRSEGYPALPVINWGVTEMLPNGKPRFYDARSEWWWRLREAFQGSEQGEDGWLDIDPEDDELAQQLTAVKYRVLPNGQIRVESKDDMRARGVDSPDRADALCYSLLTGSSMPVAKHDEMIMRGMLDPNVW